MTIVYRTATRADLPQLARMRWDFRTGPEEPPPVVSRELFLERCQAFMAEGLERGDWVYWVAVEDGIVKDGGVEDGIVEDGGVEDGGVQGDRILAHIFLHLFRPVPKPFKLESRYGYLTNVYTRPAGRRGRRQGIGGELLRHVQDWAREREVPFMIVSPSEASTPFYRRAGFTFETEFMEWFLE